MKHVSIWGTPFHFEPKKIDRVGRRGQKQPKLGIFEGTNIGQFWLFLAPPANPVDFLLFKMAGKGVLHVGPASLGGLLGPKNQFFSFKNSHFLLFLAKIGGSLTPKRLVAFWAGTNKLGH